jgi:site-specific recombinase XerC
MSRVSQMIGADDNSLAFSGRDAVDRKGQHSIRPGREPMRLSSLHRRYLLDLKALGRSPLTIAAYESDFRIFLEFLGRDDTRALTETAAARFPSWLARRRDPNQRLRTGHAPAGLARRVTTVAAFCTWLVKRKEIPSNPFDGLPRPKRPKGLPRAVPTELIERLLRLKMTSRDRAVVCCFRYAGLRIGELTNLELADVDFLLGILTVRRGKGGADRTIPLDPTLREAFADWCLTRGDVSGALFPGRDGPRLNRKAIGRLLNRLCVQAGIPRFTAHQLRHTFGTEAASAGIPATDLQALMGHEDLSTTQRYVRVTGRDLERAMARLKAWREARVASVPQVALVLKSLKRVKE